MSFFRAALGVYAAWTAATWLLEGSPRTLLRPEASGLRLAYALVANVGVGLILPFWLIRAQLASGRGRPADFGLSRPLRRWTSLAAAAAAGYGLFRLSYTRPVDAGMLLHAFAQTWVVSVAEVVVCWALVGAALRIALRAWSRAAAALVAAAAASALFGAYHFAHSPPFNEPRMVVFLALVGLATTAWWLASRDILGTVVFHNFFAVTGVLGALEGKGQALAPAPAVLVTALAATALLAWPAVRWSKGVGHA